MTLSLTSVSTTILVLSTVVIYGFFAAIITTNTPFAIAGDDYNLTCNTKTAQKSLTWTIADGIMQQKFLNCTTVDIQGHRHQRYNFFCTNKTSFILNIPGAIISEEQGVTVKCYGDHPSPPFTIDVFHVPYTNLTMTGYSGSILHSGKNLKLKCTSYKGRPFANLSWMCDDKSLLGLYYNSSYESVSELSLHLNKNLSGKVCTCTATHPLWQIPLKTKSYPLQVYYASVENPRITGYNHQGSREGEHINLTCTVYGGYPLPSLTWTCDEIIMDVISQSTDVIAQTVLPLVMNRTLNERQCLCNGISPANYSGTSNVTLIVKYPPTVTIFSYEERFSNRTQYSIYCQINEGNPSSYTISWSQTVANIVVRTNRDLAKLQFNNGHNLTLIASSHNDVGLYSCSVHNNVIDLHGNMLQNKSVYIQQNFSAIFTFDNDYIFRAVYGNSFDVKIPFYCLPVVKKIDDLMWFKDDNKVQLLEENNGFKFYFLTTKLKIRFYKTYVEIDGQMAMMTISLVSNTTAEPAKIYTVINGPENISVTIIIGCSVAGFVVVAVAVIIIMRLVMKTRTDNDKDRDKKHRSDNNSKRQKETYLESYSYENVNETNENKDENEQRPISHQYEDIIETNQNKEAKEETQLNHQYEDIIGPNTSSKAKEQSPISHQYALLLNDRHAIGHVKKLRNQTDNMVEGNNKIPDAEQINNISGADISIIEIQSESIAFTPNSAQINDKYRPKLTSYLILFLEHKKQISLNYVDPDYSKRHGEETERNTRNLAEWNTY